MRFDLLPPSTTGIHFQNQLTPTDQLNILTYLYYYNGGGVGAGDFNNDGLIDLYFTGNQVADRLYLNRGKFKFKDITITSGIHNEDGWTTGVSLVDINHDGWLDIYVCKVGKYRSIQGHNLLYVNQGTSHNEVPTFKEEAEKFGLNIVSFSTQAVFFDYDLDHDLDMFLLNHSVHPNRAFGKGVKRLNFDSLSGDKLYENHEGKFMDISKQAGIYQGTIGYGLGVSISDLTNDGYPDIYVGNDFFENDYLYIHQKDGTFQDIIANDTHNMGHTTHYSMGNAITDLNGDGRTDILSLDMLPNELATYKSSGMEHAYPVYAYFLKNGYHPQYTQNTLHLNLGNGKFSEIGFASGIAATEWSWTALVQDLNMDGIKDIYITNGIVGATNDMDFINFIAQELLQQKIEEGSHDMLTFTKKLPSKKAHNYAYQGKRDLTYQDVSSQWFQSHPSFSNGGIYADLDNDGDPDIVINNIDKPAFVYKNNTINRETNYLKVHFQGPPKNTLGIGARVEVYAGTLFLMEENYPIKSYLSSVPTEIIFGLGNHKTIDSLKIIWPGGNCERKHHVAPNQRISADFRNATELCCLHAKEPPLRMLHNVKPTIDFIHTENQSLEFDRDPLIPFGKGNEGPKISVADVNGDGLDDFFVGGAKWQPSKLFTQDSIGNFSAIQQDLWNKHAKNEDTDHEFFDMEGDGDLDLIVVSGGNEFKTGETIRPQLYENTNEGYQPKHSSLHNIEVNASLVKAVDLENDGDLDLIIGSNTIPGEFGKPSTNYLLVNDGSGVFKDLTNVLSKTFRKIGLIEDISIVDIDENGFQDLIVVGYWMPISIFMNNGRKLKDFPIENSNGWWNCVQAADFDKDGDTDVVAGNWGYNTRLKASNIYPIELYLNDFDSNGEIDPILTYYYEKTQTTLASKDELTKQLPYLNKKYLSYKRYARAGLPELFTAEKLASSEIKLITELASCYFENTGDNTYVKRPLPLKAQFSSVWAIQVEDLDENGFMDLLLVGNQHEISTQLGRSDASHGVVLLNDQHGFFTALDQQSFDISGPARDIEQINIRGEKHLMISINNGLLNFLKKATDKYE